MIYITDSFLDPQTFKDLQDYCNQPFETKTVGDKQFSVLQTPNNLIPLLQMDGHTLILTFLRSAYKGFDEDPNIHCDYTINQQKTDVASVLYITESKSGTAFFEHHKYGYKAPEDLSNEEFDRLLNEDANDLTKWKQCDFISARENRLLIYDAKYWHSKWPSKIKKGTRKILVCFYARN
jgi:hypothetical protein